MADILTGHKERTVGVADRDPIPYLPSPEERRRLRMAFGVSQTELAKELGVSKQAVSKYEASTSPTGETRVKYARILNIWAERLERNA